MSSEVAPLYYMRLSIQQYYYNEIKQPGSLENAVDNFWLNLLTHYFKNTDGFGIEQESRPLPTVSKQRADWTIRYIKNGSPKKVVLMEDKRKGYESRPAEWRRALQQLTRYFYLVRSEPGQVRGETLYGAVNIGTYTRFYELHHNEQSCVDYVGGEGYDGAALELVKDEAMVHRILTEIVEKTRH